ncbi:MAG: hypothetical protein CL609_17020 [Anaerolineaceae bacterium]|nr:hypothetical protein [Anaerolineaceae bacterium]
MSSAKNDDLQRIIESAQRMGVEMDEADALSWLSAITAQNQSDIQLDERTGIFGHTITLLDFDDSDLAHFRQVGKLVEFDDIPGKVETALALSGSAAQSKIQTYPGDADFFERVNIIADTKEEACVILSEILRKKALDTIKGDTYQLIEVKFGSYPFNIVTNGKLQHQGNPIAWYPEQIQAGKILGKNEKGEDCEITWEDVSHDPGWCKLDWVVADPVRKKLVNASNMLDVSWEGPDGKIVPLDGYLDSYFQEVYLDGESIHLFSKLVKHVSGDALDHYVEQLEKEVKKYVTKDPNFGKAAKRLYNIFRLTGRYSDAAFLRELFDEPTTILYQVGALIRTIDESFQPGSKIDRSTILSQADQLILGVTMALEGVKEIEIVEMLLNFRNLLAEDINRGELSSQANAVRAELVNIVNNFFYEKLTGVDSIKTYLDELQN